MKNKITLAFMLLFCAVFTSAQTLTNVFSDTFESYTVGDAATAHGYSNTNSTTGSSQVISTGTGANSSAKYVNMTGATSGNNCYLTKSVNVTIGQTYIYSVYVLGVSNHTYSVSYNGTSLGNHSSGTITGNGAWQKQSFTFTATATENVSLTIYEYATGNVYVDDISLQREQWNINATSNNVSYGSVSGTGQKDPGTSVSLTATPQSGYYFVNWTENGTPVSVSSLYSFTSSADRTLVANFAPVSASMTLTGTLSSFSSTYGTASAEQSFTVAGSSLTTDIVVTPPTGFEVSLTSGSGFQSSVTLTQSSGTVATTTVYVRMKALAAAGTYSAANITVNTTGSSQNVSCSGTQAKKALSVTGYSIASKEYNGSTASGTITIGTITGCVGTETVTATASCTLSSPNVYGEQGTIIFTLVNGTNGGLASNYSLANGSYWAPITQRQLNITAGNQTVTYGTAASAVTAAGTYTPSGFIGSDNSGLMTGTATYTTTYTNTTAVGTAGVTITYNTGLSTTYSNYWMNKIAGTITITAATPTVTPTVGTYTYNGSPQGPNAATNNGTGSSYTYSYAGVAPTVYSASSTAPSAAGTYTVTVTVAANGNYTSASSAATAFTIYSTGVVTAASTNVSSLVLSTASDISITGSGSLLIDVNNTSLHSVIAAPGTQLTISSGKSLSLSGNLQLQSDASGTATLVDQTTSGGLTVSGTSTVQQYLAGARNWYISSPVSAAKAQNSYTFYRRDEANNAWPSMTAGDGVTTGDALNVGQGYIANLASGTATYTFTGTLNTNDKAIGLSYSNGVSKAGFNLIGNPYPSHYTVTKSATDAANALNTIWYRTATWVEDLITPANSKYVYSFQTCLLNSDNVTYVGTPSGTSPIIPPMQSFWVRTNTAGSSFTFANTQRSHQNSNLLKAPAQKNISEPILRLQVSNGTISDETVLYSNSNASDAYDSYDALKINNNSSSVPEIYTLVDNQQVAINGLNNIPFEKEIPIGFTTLSSGMFSIKASQISNFSSGTQLIFKDYTDVNNPVITDLSDGSSYSFSSAVTSNNISRFALIFHAPTIATGSNPGSNSNVWISTCNGQIMINGIGTSEANLELFNALGQKVSSKNLTKTNTQLSTNLAAGAYLLKITIEGKTITRKIIID